MWSGTTGVWRSLVSALLTRFLAEGFVAPLAVKITLRE